MNKNLINQKNNNNLKLADIYMEVVISTLEKSLKKEKNFKIKKSIYEKIIKSYKELEKFL